MTKRIIFGAIAAVALAGCTHDLTSDDSPEYHNRQAKDLLAAVDFNHARDEYALALSADPHNSEAAFGWAFCDLLLIADRKPEEVAPEPAPVSEALTRCNQPGLSFGRDLFGPNGVLAQAAAAAEGGAALSVHHFSDPGAGASLIPFAPSSIRARLIATTRSGAPYNELSVTLSERVSNSTSRSLVLYLNADDVTRNDTAIVPLSTGLTVDLAEADGSVSFSDVLRPDVSWGSDVRLSGQLVFHRVGTAIGDRIDLELVDVNAPAYCSGVGTCSASYRLSGTISDVLSPQIDIPATNVPFIDLSPDSGPPRRELFYVGLERCSRFDTHFLAQKVEQLGDLLATDSEKLAIVLDASNADDFAFTIPQRLLHARADFPINATDVRALKAAVDLTAAHASLIAQYQYLIGDLQNAIADATIWYGDDTPDSYDDPYGPETQLATRQFNWTELAMQLDLGFLVPESGLDLSVFQARLRSGLRALVDALRRPASAPGLLNFQVLPARRLTGELADALDALDQSITSAQPVALPNSPGWAVHLKAYFDQPLDAARLKMLSGLGELWRSDPGDPQATAWQDKNDKLVFTLAEEASRRNTIQVAAEWSGGVLSLPPDRSTQTCDAQTSCGSGYHCDGGGHCQIELPHYMSGSAWGDLFDGGWPIFLSTIIRDELVVN